MHHPAPGSSSLSSVSRIVAIMGLFGIVLTLAATAYVAWQEHRQRFNDASDQLRTEAFFLSDHANRLFEVSRVALESAASLTTDKNWDAIAADATLTRQLRTLARSIPYIEDIWLNDAKGDLKATSFLFPAPPLNAADRENFEAAERPVRELFIGPLILGRVTHKPTFMISSRIEEGDGTFRGMASVTAELTYFSDYWRGLALPYDARVTITRAPKLEVLASYPKRAEAVTTPAGLAEAVATGAGEGLFASRSAGRFGAFRRVGDHPIYLTIDIANAAVEADLKTWFAHMLPVPALAVALFGGLTWLALRGSRREREAQSSLAAANAELRIEMAGRERAEAELRHLQKMEAIGQLTGGIAHDFNNMLAIIVSSLGLLERRLARGERDVDRYVAAAQEGANRAAALTQRLLAFARKQPLAPQPIDVNRFVAGLSELMQRTLTEAIRIETVLGEAIWRVHADPVQLENAILNLAVNARDAMPGGGRLTVETANAVIGRHRAAATTEVPPGHYVLIAVRDTGVGMPPDVVARAFEPFFTTKAVGKGSGLGLSQVYGFVRQSGGHVAITSEAGVGTSVAIYLPRFEGPDAHSEPERLSPVMRPTGSRDELILVVEDDAAVRRLSVDALRELGYTVLHANSGQSALDIIQKTPRIDLLFTDVIMPEMNGRELAERARALRPEIKVLYATGYMRDAVMHNGMLDAGTNLLAKPFSIDQLAVSVRAALDA